MLMTALPFALAAATALQTSSDTTFTVRPDARLELRDARGTVVVEGWDQSTVRVRADHGSRDRLQVVDRGVVVTVRTTRDAGRPAAVNYRISVPRNMPLTLAGQDGTFEVNGVHGDLRIETVEGAIMLRDVGLVSANTVEGDITIRGAASEVRVNTTDGDLTLSDVRGNLNGRTLDGDVYLERIDAAQVDMSTVDGDIHYDGVVHDGGRYRLTTHDGDITLYVPPSINATVNVATFDGDFEATFPVQIQPGAHRGHRFSFTIGSGSAQIELESFDGEIRLRNR